MARLAFVSPLPPAATGIADYTAEVLHALGRRHEVEAFTDAERVEAGALPAGLSVRPAATFSARHAARPFDLAVHQLGNAPAHEFQYPLLGAAPALVVLHDLVLHHARARAHLDGPAVRAYAQAPAREDLRQAAARAIGAYHGLVAGAFPAAADRLVAVQLGTVGDLLPYAYPLFQDVARAARAVAVHNGAMAAAVAEGAPGVPVARVAMPAVRVPVAAGAAADARRALGLAADDLVVGCLGLVTREKRIETVARAVARAAPALPRLRLLLVGEAPDRAWLEGVLARAGVAGLTRIAGRVPMGALAAHLEAMDVVAHLRWPTARETSAALLRALAQGRPTVMSDLENLAEIPDDAVVRVDVADEEGALTRALLRLLERPALRAALGARAAAHVARAHAPSAVADSYDRAIALGLSR